MNRLEYDLTNDDYVAFNERVARTAPGVVDQYRRIRMIGTVATAVAIGLLVREPVEALVMAALVGTVMWFAFVPIVRRSMRAQLRRLAKAGNLGRLGPTVLTWDPYGITESATDSEASVGWPRVTRIDETDDHLFVFTGDLEALVVPRRAGADVAELAVYARTQLESRRPV